MQLKSRLEVKTVLVGNLCACHQSVPQKLTVCLLVSKVSFKAYIVPAFYQSVHYFLQCACLLSKCLVINEVSHKSSTTYVIVHLNLTSHCMNPQKECWLVKHILTPW